MTMLLSPPEAHPTERRAAPAAMVIVIVTAIALGAAAFAQNHSMVRSLEWPAVDTQYRELAAAQTILDEGYGPDSAYRQERVWYNPMAPWIVTALVRATGVPARIVVARSGPWLNLLAPLALFTVVALLFDGCAALGAAAAFIFITGSAFPYYYAPTYSPWFGPENFGQAFFYLGLAVALAAFERPFSLARAGGLGLALGITFLTHTAPALVLGCTMLVLAFWQGWAKANWRFPTLTLALALAVAFVVALPFGVEILWHYRLKIVNVYPGLSPSDLLDLNELPRVARAAATLPAIGGAAALAWRATSARGDRGTRLLLAWLGVVTLFLGAHVAALLAAKAGLDLPTIVPAFHFFFYLMAIVSIGVGLALRDLSAAAIRWLDRQRTGVADGLLDWRAAILVSGTTVLLVAAYYQSYLGRADFTEVQGRAALMNREMPADAYAWIASHTSPDDVFLCSDDQSLYVVTPAGRKVVATNRYFSSPYVDWAAREADRAEMFRRLARRDVEGFRSLAGRYQVGYVILPERAPSESWLKVAGMVSGDVPPLKADDLALTPGFGVAFRGERVAIVAVRYPPG